jgi:hypothetical protein
MRKIAVSMLALALFGWLSVTPVLAASKADFALLNMPGGDVSVQAGATGYQGNKFKPTSFVVHITMTNGGVDGHVKVAYQDGDGVNFAIAANATLQISLAGGGTPGVDQIITVTGINGAVLVGQISLITDNGQPHPDLPGQTTPRAVNFCSTTRP